GCIRVQINLRKAKRTYEIAVRQNRNLCPLPLDGQARTKLSCRWDPAQAPRAAQVSLHHAWSARSGRRELVATGSTNWRQRANLPPAPMRPEASSKLSGRRTPFV